MKRKALIAGYRLEATRKRLDEPATVIIHKLGAADGRAWLTPAEARKLAADLIAIADYSESDS
jgi:hypothetical protein